MWSVNKITEIRDGHASLRAFDDKSLNMKGSLSHSVFDICQRVLQHGKLTELHNLTETNSL